jgi:hypothetical protein
MRHRMLCGIPVLTLTLAACGTEPVVLNERLFLAESMQSVGRGCYVFVLGSGARVESTSGEAMGRMKVKTRLDQDEVVVSVQDGDRTLVEKRYGESFFRARSLDQFTAGPAFASDTLLLRYWGSFHPNGVEGCAPLEDDEPR